MPEAPSRRLSEYRFEKAATWKRELGNRNFKYIHETLLNHSMSQLFGENWRARETEEGLMLKPLVRKYVNEHFNTFFNSFESRWNINAPRHGPGEVYAMVRNELEAHKQYQIPYPGPLAIFPEEITKVTRLLAEKRQFMTGKQVKILQTYLNRFYNPEESGSPLPKYPPGYKTEYPRIERDIAEREKNELKELAGKGRGRAAVGKGARALEELAKLKEKYRALLRRKPAEAREKPVETRVPEKKPEDEKARHEEKLRELEKKIEEERKKREEAEKKAGEEAKNKKIEIRTKPKITIFAPAMPAGGAAGGGGAEGEWWTRNVAAWGAIVAAVAILLILSMTIFK